MSQTQLEDDVLRAMDKYADQLVMVEALEAACDRQATCDCPPDACQRLLEAQRKMCELRGILCTLLQRLGYTPQPKCGKLSEH